MLLVQLGINSTRDVWKICQIGLAPAARPILAKFANITCILLIPNCTHQRMITYTILNVKRYPFLGHRVEPLLPFIKNYIISFNIITKANKLKSYVLIVDPHLRTRHIKI